ncbi:MAG TPA: hypothetical protein VH300_03940 [Thermoleophilaceae bacterium]|nr:hypothetical protein [Thermoleophilaceae bacterium]
MTDWVTISSLATAGGTLALAGATFAATQSSNRNARIAEVALRQQLRPVLMTSQLDDPEQKIMFAGGHWVRVPGGGAVVEHLDGVVYLSLSLRNVGSGIGVLLGWSADLDYEYGQPHRQAGPDEFRSQIRDLWIPAGSIGLWQGALRDDSEEIHGRLRDVVASPRIFLLDLLYSDHLGAQRSISRFSLVPGQEGRWMAAVVRHWQVDA